MKTKTYNILRKIPIAGSIAQFICQPYKFCSPGMDDGVYEPLFKYMKEHPDILMTEELAKEILSKYTK